MEKYRNPLVSEGEYISPMTKNVKNMFKLLNSLKEFEILNITKILTNGLNTLQGEKKFIG